MVAVIIVHQIVDTVLSIRYATPYGQSINVIDPATLVLAARTAGLVYSCELVPR
jgi:hypothetical protein